MHSNEGYDIKIKRPHSLAAYVFLNSLYFLSNKNRVTELDRHRSLIALTCCMIWGRLINHLFIYKDKENTTYPVWLSQTLNKIAYGEKNHLA